MIHSIANARTHAGNVAVKTASGKYTYQDLLDRSSQIAADLLNGRQHLNEARIAFIMNPGFEYVATQWGIWRAGGVAVPLCVKHPFVSLQYVIEDTAAEQLIYTEEYQELIAPFESFKNLGLKEYHSIGSEIGQLPEVDSTQRAMILYTSGTTGKPKGVVTTHDNLAAQVSSLVEAWQWTAEDQILNVLPLHHIHGILNATCCPLSVGACVEFLDQFDPEAVFKAFLGGDVNIFMAVPTIYFKLVNVWKEYSEVQKQEVLDKLSQFRFMVSGSAALPVSVLEEWRGISGQTLLERYGMTEIGMAISNPYDGERRPGYIGKPLPGVGVRLFDESGEVVEEGVPGEIQIKGPTVFQEYWEKPEATAESFTEDGWFKTGDTAVIEDGYYRILGRNSVDIIKSGGYKISALEIEEVLRKYAGIKDCGVVGLPDDEWGEIIGAGLIADEKSLDMNQMNAWLREQLPNYKIPRKYVFLEDLPRNVMGKVTKKELKTLF
ncbi:acyl-CoA synthetase [Jiulongibacter sediminis]|jgi:malonyl-CoA/methylmalonyl-CoA synthetase|uniref:acyl-CoA synthetase n=1 Tax=Jiulongibacter sediminis TaxID=1605367 RepID=UPI0026EEE57F|nr:acyl-CoA synthetase [Jiulongibacter sediminis]